MKEGKIFQSCFLKASYMGAVALPGFKSALTYHVIFTLRIQLHWAMAICRQFDVESSRAFVQPLSHEFAE